MSPPQLISSRRSSHIYKYQSPITLTYKIMTNKLIRINTMGIERVRTDAAKSFTHRQHAHQNDDTISEAETDTTLLISNRTPSVSPKKTHVIQVELSNVLSDDKDMSFEVQFENAVVIHDNGVEKDEGLVEDEDESAIEVIYV